MKLAGVSVSFLGHQARHHGHWHAGEGHSDRSDLDQPAIQEHADGTQVFDGYTVRNMFVVTLNDARVETLISKALESGVNYLLGVEFQTSELKKYRDEARELAVRAAGAGWGPNRAGDSGLSQVVVQASGGETQGAVALGKSASAPA